MQKLTIAFLLVLAALTLGCNSEQPWQNWKAGDILFQNGDCGDFCDAIKKVTSGYQGQSFSHNGMLIIENGNWMVLEAISQGVQMTALEDFLNRHTTENGYPKVIVGRLKEQYQHLIPEAILFGKTLIGKPYDDGFDLDNEAYYCSELIHFSLMKANKGLPVFDTPPMTFKDPATNETFSVWEKYFEKLNLEIPEGEPGLNPGGMSLSPALNIIHNFENP
ncbi:YiiX/YebB-like N1pC/P60 family cysteine hydrolase [uncultured Cyclobacterium sp.]|uniref:YiiX/YebB-like N1pC/P60 family cysteine hydrolase n=1 Tax=uncultured Cyclobacterium sp. TaxID=453820 RepID=UPI0030EB1FED|tara:strand:+ start:48880 stop:49539 length:660 start_codon:yes stop_codon:yes gene_type:complete